MTTAAGMPILLVEDDPNDVALVSRAIRRGNLTNPVEAVTDGETAVSYLEGHGAFADRTAHPLPVLILLDLNPPMRSGHEVLSWLREREVLRRIPVAGLISSMEPGEVDLADDAGVDAYLVKPVDVEALIELVASVDLFWLILNDPPEDAI
jgi:CheY-like chemotaxis protein